MHQEHATHRNALPQSRLDHIYVTQHISEQLDTAIGCGALDWARSSSDHRPLIVFRKRRSGHRPFGSGGLPLGPMKVLSWPDRVRASFLPFHTANLAATGALDRLYLLKEAIASTTWQMQAESHFHRQCPHTTESDDKLGWAIRFIRVAERRRFRTMGRCVEAYPYLATLAEVADPNVRTGQGLLEVRQHALELHRCLILEELRDIQKDEGRIDEDIRRVRRSRVQVKLQRLRPGASNAIAVLQCADGSLATEAKDIAAEFHRHWHQIFQQKPCDHDCFDRWLTEELPGASVSAIRQNNLPWNSGISN